MPRKWLYFWEDKDTWRVSFLSSPDLWTAQLSGPPKLSVEERVPFTTLRFPRSCAAPPTGLSPTCLRISLVVGSSRGISWLCSGIHPEMKIYQGQKTQTKGTR